MMVILPLQQMMVILPLQRMGIFPSDSTCMVQNFTNFSVYKYYLLLEKTMQLISYG
jgi:hypothetical protein